MGFNLKNINGLKNLNNIKNPIKTSLFYYVAYLQLFKKKRAINK